MSLDFVQGDDAPDVTSVLHQEADPTQLLDLTDCTVKFQMRRADDRRFTVNAAAVIDDAVHGAVHYSWSANDLMNAGDFQIQWEVTYLGGKVQTTAPTEALTIRRK